MGRQQLEQGIVQWLSINAFIDILIILLINRVIFKRGIFSEMSNSYWSQKYLGEKRINY